MNDDTKWLMEAFSEEALQAQDGKTVPLRLGNGGPVVGEATLHYESDKGLMADFEVTDPKVAELLKGDGLSGLSIFKKDN